EGRFEEAAKLMMKVGGTLSPEAKEASTICSFHLAWIRSREGASGGPTAEAARAQAVDVYAGVLRDSPDNVQALRNYVLALDAAGRPAEATQRLEEAVRVEEPDPAIGALLMDRYSAASRMKDAWAVGIRLLKTSPNDFRIHDRLINCRAGLGSD